MTSHERLDRLALTGLSLAPSQVWGGIRLVPVLRADAPGDLRLARRAYAEDLTVVGLDDGAAYVSYVPHALVTSWRADGGPTAAFGVNLRTRDGKRYGSHVRVTQRMARREARGEASSLRLLPLHLAMEGFLAMYFGGPDIAWTEYSRRARRTGLSPRIETSVPGRWIAGLDDALRVFEIHHSQVGVLVFVADALASAFVVSHPADYRALHRTVLDSFYGELMWHYGTLDAGAMHVSLDAAHVRNLDDLARAVEQVHAAWADFHGWMAEGILERPVDATQVYRCGRFRLHRFVTDLDPARDNHIGEVITRPDGTIEYLQTYRLSAAQVRRAYLLKLLASHDWSLDATAAALGRSRAALVTRLEKAQFGYLLAPHVRREIDRRVRARPR